MSQKTIKVNKSDLPLSCPGPKSSLAEMHPKVYLPVKQAGGATCPYCSAHYELED